MRKLKTGDIVFMTCERQKGEKGILYRPNRRESIIYFKDPSLGWKVENELPGSLEQFLFLGKGWDVTKCSGWYVWVSELRLVKPEKKGTKHSEK